jgi:hypothetical protein
MKMLFFLLMNKKGEFLARDGYTHFAKWAQRFTPEECVLALRILPDHSSLMCSAAGRYDPEDTRALAAFRGNGLGMAA